MTTQDIGVDPTGANLAVGLSCNTTYDRWCSDFTSMNRNTKAGIQASGKVSWLYANNILYPFVRRQEDRPDFTYGIKRNGNAVYLFRNRGAMSGLSGVDGIWRCVIPDRNGNVQTKYIGVFYSNETNNGYCNN